MTKNIPNFYAIIPASVRYCKALPAQAKLLYGEITALCSKEGFCWAGNKYFAELYEVHETTITRWIKNLKEEGFIEVEVYKDGLDTTRNIWITPELKLSLRNSKNAWVEQSKNNGVETLKNDGLLLQANINTKKAASCLKEKAAAASAPKIDPLKFEHEIYQNDKELYDKVIEWYSSKYAKKAPKSKLAVLKSCIKEKWYEEEVEEAKQNDQERDLNVKFAREVEKRYQKTDRPSLSDFKAIKSGIVFISGTKEITIPSYDMPHELFKKMVKDIFESRGIWEDLVKVKL